MAKEEEKAQGSRTVLWVALAAALSLALGAGGAFWVVTRQQAEREAEQAAAEQAENSPEAQARRLQERMVPLDPFVVNVSGDGYNRFLKLQLELQAESPELKTEIDARLPQVRDALIVLLSSKRLSDITDYEGKALLKQDILERVNDLLESGDVESVLFTEFVVQ